MLDVFRCWIQRQQENSMFMAMCSCCLCDTQSWIIIRIYIRSIIYVWNYSGVLPQEGDTRKSPLNRDILGLAWISGNSPGANHNSCCPFVRDLFTSSITYQSYENPFWLVVWNMFIFPYGNNHPNWLIFFRGVKTTNQHCFFSRIDPEMMALS